ncbi:ATP-binding cassette domain-containing protein [uncultured Pelagimonas sp.]|uniref:ABC transporter ATP-binding protein n=1 Tax=uncultured Pelagimonas sp. TaxID=1618102 RepID=UPI0026374F8B|nr:ATP-binding cassette domain-containing protein [uncultured Pelagimonas sp.]
MALQLVHDQKQDGRREVARIALARLSLGGRAILGQVEFSLHSGDTLALTGPSGIGKTSLLRVLAGLETRFDGNIIKPTKIAVVFQEPTLLLWRNVIDNLCLPLGVSRAVAEQALDEVGLAGRGAAFPGQLSLGQQRRLSLARAFAANPDLLLMDEPFVSLDDDLANEMMSLFETLRARHDTTTLIVTHSESEAKRLCNRVLRLDGSPAVLV